MLFWIFMLLMDLLMPLVMIILGHCFAKKPPRKINAAFGYRTAMSMKNKDTWEFAHKYFGKIWEAFGWFLLLVSAVIMFFALGKGITMVGIIGGAVSAVQLVVVIGTLLFTEIVLKKNFDKNGKR